MFHTKIGRVRRKQLSEYFFKVLTLAINVVLFNSVFQCLLIYYHSHLGGSISCSCEGPFRKCFIKRFQFYIT